MRLSIILEKGESGEWFASVDAPNTFLTTVGNSVQEITQNFKGLIQDHLNHEGRTQPEWKGVIVDDVEWEYLYDLSGFFEQFNALKISAIADLAGLNHSLVRQYASGGKSASAAQVQKIQNAVHQLAQSLLKVSVTA
jgi:predicted RNase H-like HicB family nuclease